MTTKRRGLTRKHGYAQPGVLGHPRRQLSTRVHRRIEEAIRREQARYGVSRSWVIARACAFAFNIVEDKDDYR